MKFAVIVFPGSNCDHDAYHAAKHVLGQDAEFVWHKDTSLGGADVVILPGGFSHGDYLRTGAIARFSPVMAAVAASPTRAARCSASATASRSCSSRACCPARCCATATSSSSASTSALRVEQTDTPFTGGVRQGQVLRMPIAHGEGNYFAPPETLDALERDRRVIFRYVDPASGRADATRRTRTARSATSPASATSAATWSA